MNISDTIAPNSDQVNAEDLIAGPRNVTITQVEKGSTEQPVFIHLAEFPGRTYRPSKSMRRVLVAAWGPEASDYIGRRLTIYRNPDITFGRDRVGGIQISALSHIDKPLTIALTVSRGKRAPVLVQPLAEAPKPSTGERVANAVKAIRQTTTAADLQHIRGRISSDIANEQEIVDALRERHASLSAGGAS